MLLIMRRKGEEVFIGEDIRVRVDRVDDRGWVRLAVKWFQEETIFKRFVNEVIFLGEDIWIMVCDLDRGQVRLGFEAPRDVLILRKELRDSDRPYSERMKLWWAHVNALRDRRRQVKDGQK